MIIGRLTRDPELRATREGVQVCTFNVAVNRKIMDMDKTTFFKVNAWRNLAENCAKYLQKGRLVGVIGEVDVETYKTRDGEARAEMVVHAAEVEFIGGQAQQAGAFTQASPAPQPAQKKSDEYIVVTEGELPF